MPFWSSKTVKNVGFPCVFAQNGPPKGGQKWSQNEPKMEPFWVQIWAKKGSKIHRNRSLLGTRPKTEGKKLLEFF